MTFLNLDLGVSSGSSKYRKEIVSSGCRKCIFGVTTSNIFEFRKTRWIRSEIANAQSTRHERAVISIRTGEVAAAVEAIQEVGVFQEDW